MWKRAKRESRQSPWAQDAPAFPCLENWRESWGLCAFLLVFEWNWAQKSPSETFKTFPSGGEGLVADHNKNEWIRGRVGISRNANCHWGWMLPFLSHEKKAGKFEYFWSWRFLKKHLNWEGKGVARKGRIYFPLVFLLLLDILWISPAEDA